MITLELNIFEAGHLESLLWEVIHENHDGMSLLRDNLPETAIWRKLNAAIGRCPDCGGRGATTENGVEYCNCEDGA